MPIAGADRINAHRAHRCHGPDGARARRAPAGGRPVAGGAPEEPADRPRRGRAVCARPWPRAVALVGSWRKAGGTATTSPRAKRLIDGWRARVDTVDPHAFFARILGPEGGREAFLRRLGPEAEDVLDEFLAQALAYEQTNTPSLEGFLAWLVAAETEVRRDTDTLRDEVRVMTVHGAKGLEADIVFLVDNGTPPSIPGHDPKVLSLADDPDPLSPGPVVWMRIGADHAG